MFGTIWGSVHLLCHGDASLDDLCLMLSEMEHVAINLRRRHHTSRIVIRSDLNVSLAPNLKGLTGYRIHPNANSASSRWREAVTEWMHSLRLRAACTFDYENTGWHNVWDYEEKWTHENSNKARNINWTTCWFLIMFEEKPPWYVAMTWAVITGLLMQIFVWSIKRSGNS